MHILIAILFLVFATVQYNDPDFHIWIPAYLVVTILIILYVKGKNVTNWFFIVSLVYAIWMSTYIPNLIEWVQRGFPSITGTMNAESPFIEFVREFFGLLICLATTLYYGCKSR